MAGKEIDKDYIEKCIQKYLQSHVKEIRGLLLLDAEEALDKEAQKDLQEQMEDLQIEKQFLQEQLQAGQVRRASLKDSLAEREKFSQELASANKKLKEENLLLTQKNEQLKAEIARNREEYRSAYTDLVTEKDFLLETKKALELEFHKAKQKQETITRDMDVYLRRYGRLEEVYQEYLQLQPDIRERELYRLCGPAKSSLGLFAALLQKDNLATLWEYIAYGINNEQFQSGDEERLKRLFDFCFDTINASQEEPVYQRLACAEGEEYDNRYMVKASNSRQQGDIKIVALQGYVQIINRKVIKASLVSLG